LRAGILLTGVPHWSVATGGEFALRSRGNSSWFRLYTIGYEGTERELLVKRLLEQGVDTLVDVREVSVSRRPGFSKSQLSAFVSQKGIEYIHKRELGSPSEARRRLKVTGDFAEFFRGYMRHLEAHSHVLHEVKDLVEHQNCCLLCYEHRPEKCHRRILADELKKLENGRLEVIHL